MSLEVTTNFKDSNRVDLGTKLVTKDYLISVYPSIGQQIGLTPELWVWGSGSSGQLGTNDTTNRSTPVTTISGGSVWKQVSGGDLHTAAIKTDGTLWTWGYGVSLGNSSFGSFSSPSTTFAGGTNWKQISCGSVHTAAIKTDGTLWVWGNGIDGKLGTSENFPRNVYTPITTFSGGTNWANTATGVAEELYTLSAGYRSNVAIKTDGTLWTWGYGTTGATGNATFFNAETPSTTFAGGITWKQVSCGRHHAAAIKTDGTLWIWGSGTDGRLGNGYTTSVSTPITTFTGGTDWKQVSAGYIQTAAIKTDGTLWTWGNNFDGQLGRLFGTTIAVPTIISKNWADTATGVAEELYTFSGGKTHSAGIKTDGTLWTWGNNAYGLTASGQLGIGAGTTERSTPTTTFAGGSTWKQVSVGYYHTAAIKTDGTLWTWGNGGSGRLGNNLTANRSTPVTTFAGGTTWKQVACGSFHTAAIKTDGTLWTWGQGSYGALGDATIINKNTPVTTFAGGTTWKNVSAGNNATAAIKTDGTLWTWGSNINGEAGINISVGGNTKSTPVTTFAGGTNWSQVSCGILTKAAIKTDGTLWTWGYSGSGRLGNGIITGNRSTPVTTFAGGTNWKQVACGNGFNAAVKTDGTLWTWGIGSNGRLGTNNTTSTSTPVTTFAGGTTWKQVAAGDTHTIALRDDGTTKELFSFGNNIRGQLGSAVSQNFPGQVFSYTNNWKQVCSGGRFMAAIKTDGTLWTWGNSYQVQLGTNSTTNVSTPVTTFAGGTTWKQVSCSMTYTAAIKTDGTLWTWGNGNSGRLGNGGLTTRSTPVTTFAGGTNWSQVSCGMDLLFAHTAAVKTDGTLWTWGNNNFGPGDGGKLGNNSPLDTSTPVTTFAGGTNWKQVSAGGQHTIALSDDTVNKRLFVFGSNTRSALGVRITVLTPVTTFSGGTTWKQVSCGTNATAAVKTDGTLWTWGNSSQSQLGTNNTTNASTPVTTFAGGTTWKQVACGGNHTAAIKTDGTLWTWGYNNSAQLGTNDTTTKSTPVTTFAGGTNWKQVAGGFKHTTAIKTDGTLWTWGYNVYGQLGDNTLGSKLTPITTFAGGTNWKQVAGGSKHTAAIKTDGTLWTWGYNFQVQIGTNDLTQRNTPVTTFAGGTIWKQVACGTKHTAAIKSTDII